MSGICEIVESTGVATGVHLDPELIPVGLGVGRLTNTLFLEFNYTSTNVGSSSSETFDDSFALLIDGVLVSEEYEASVETQRLVVDLGRGRSATFLEFTESVTEAADGTAEATTDTPDLVSEFVVADSEITINSETSREVSELATATDQALSSQDQDVEVTGSAASTTIFQTTTGEFVTESAASEVFLFLDSVAAFTLAVSQGLATSSVDTQVESYVFVSSTATAQAAPSFVDKTLVAWALNTETGAAWTLSNYQFDSIAAFGGKLLAIGPDGLYELSGTTDQGEPISAEIQWGFTDFKTPNLKRLSHVYIGYTSDGPLDVTVETYGNQDPVFTYQLEERAAEVARSNRFPVGRGLASRYWRFTLSNQEGAKFRLHDMSADVSVSERRING